MARTTAGTRTAAGSRFTASVDLGKCINFDQSTSKVTFTVPTSFNPANLTSFSCAAWVFLRSLGGGSGGRICETGAGAAGKGWLMLVGSTGFNLQTAFNTTNASVQSGAGTIKFGQWQRILMTWSDADNVPKCYIKGIEYAASSTSKSGSRLDVSSSTATIGNRTANDRRLDGLMDEFCVWNRILTASEIEKDAALIEIPTSGLILRYKYDETSGSLTDSSSSGLTGTVANCTQNVAGITYSRTAA